MITFPQTIPAIQPRLLLRAQSEASLVLFIYTGKVLLLCHPSIHPWMGGKHRLTDRLIPLYPYMQRLEEEVVPVYKAAEHPLGAVWLASGSTCDSTDLEALHQRTSVKSKQLYEAVPPVVIRPTTYQWKAPLTATVLGSSHPSLILWSSGSSSP